MYHKFLLALILFFSIQGFAQNDTSIQRTVTKVDNQFSLDKLYNKVTGKKLTRADFIELVNKNPNLDLEKVYDNSGNVIKYLYDPRNLNSNNNSRYKALQPGDKFPEFVFKTLEGKTVNIKDLKGKLVIVRMEMEADTFRFKKYEIENLDQAINQSQRKSEIVAVILFRADKNTVERGFDLKNSNFIPIPSADNFQDQLNIKYFPSTMLLDKEGRVMKIYKSSNVIDIEKALDEASGL